MERNPPWRVLGRSSLCGGFDCCEQLRELAELSALVIELLVLSDLTLFTDERGSGVQTSNTMRRLEGRATPMINGDDGPSRPTAVAAPAASVAMTGTRAGPELRLHVRGLSGASNQAATKPRCAITTLAGASTAKTVGQTFESSHSEVRPARQSSQLIVVRGLRTMTAACDALSTPTTTELERDREACAATVRLDDRVSHRQTRPLSYTRSAAVALSSGSQAQMPPAPPTRGLVVNSFAVSVSKT